MTWRQFLPNIRYGTERHPEKVARRLRALNLAAWLAALVPGCFAVLRILDPERWHWGIVNALFAAGIAAIPLLHRFSPLVAPLVLVVIVYAHLFRLDYDAGTGFGGHVGYLTAAALGMVLVGSERIWLATVLAAVAAGLIILLHAVAPHATGQLSPAGMFINFAINVSMSTVVLFVVVFYALKQAARSEAAAERQYERSESLLGNILPPKVAAQLKDGAEAAGASRRKIADRYDDASILFADMAGFTVRATDTDPAELVEFLNDVFTKLDDLVDAHGLEKIKTTGDAYMVVSGLPDPRPDHADALAYLAIKMRDALAGLVDPKGRAVPVRIGIASGPVVAGVVGTRKFFYDVWGDAVNTASRMESTGEAGKIQVAPETRELLKERFLLEDRGIIEVRGKGQMRTWFLIGTKRNPPGETVLGNTDGAGSECFQRR